MRTASGFQLAINPKALDTYVSIALSGGYWERHIVDACRRVLRDEDTFFDIGANAGVITLEMAGLFRHASVYAFEPQPELARHIAISVALNRFTNTHIHCLALGEQNGTLPLYVPEHSIHASLISRSKYASRVECAIRKLDTLIEDGTLPVPDVIKIDVEGAELPVFRGAQLALRKQPPIIIFEADQNMARFGYSHRELFAAIEGFGAYDFYQIVGPELQKTDASEAKIGNFLACPRDGGKATRLETAPPGLRGTPAMGAIGRRQVPVLMLT